MSEGFLSDSDVGFTGGSHLLRGGLWFLAVRRVPRIPINRLYLTSWGGAGYNSRTPSDTRHFVEQERRPHGSLILAAMIPLAQILSDITTLISPLKYMKFQSRLTIFTLIPFGNLPGHTQIWSRVVNESSL